MLGQVRRSVIFFLLFFRHRSCSRRRGGRRWGPCGTPIAAAAERWRSSPTSSDVEAAEEEEDVSASTKLRDGWRRSQERPGKQGGERRRHGCWRRRLPGSSTRRRTRFRPRPRRRVRRRRPGPSERSQSPEIKLHSCTSKLYFVIIKSVNK